jgi:hypothetical protein
MSLDPTILAARLTSDIRGLTGRVGRTTQHLAQVAAIKPVSDEHAAAVADLKANLEKQLGAAGAQLAEAQQSLGAIVPKAP